MVEFPQVRQESVEVSSMERIDGHGRNDEDGTVVQHTTCSKCGTIFSKLRAKIQAPAFLTVFKQVLLHSSDKGRSYQ
jgi:hypothetical protein